jgi:hypothetical protein
MRYKTLAAMTVLTGLSVAGISATLHAQPAPPPAQAGAPADGGNSPDQRPRWHSEPDRPHHPMGMHEGMPGGMMGAMHHGHERMIDPSLFAMMYRPDDRKLTPPDVQKIAESILVWFGNRTWKVTEVGPAKDGKIGFAYATADGSTIARFTMDTKTGKISRAG